MNQKKTTKTPHAFCCKILPNNKPCVMHAICVEAVAKFSVDMLQTQMSTKALELVERWNVSKSEI
jgi:hypothetical protein